MTRFRGASVPRALLALLALSVARCGPPPPRRDGFYIAPTRKPSAPSAARAAEERHPGKLLRSEPFKTGVPGSQAWRILYGSTGRDGEGIEVSGLVIAPTLPAPVNGRNVVAWAHPTAGVAENCAPSMRRDPIDAIPHVPTLMVLDAVLVATDYPGLGTPGPHPYLVGESEGRAVLDAVRAARQIPKVGASNRFVAWGHSQGGQAALFAGQLARSYAPELTLVGVAAIAPVTDVGRLWRDGLDDPFGRVMVADSLWAWSRVSRAPLEPYASPELLRFVDAAAQDCVDPGSGAEGGPPAPGISSDALSSAIATSPPWNRLLEENRPGREPAGAPLYVAQGMDDTVVRASVTADFVAGLCRAGATVRYEPLPGIGHARAGRVSATGAIQWMKARFDGDPAPNTCPPF
ncbi:MAG: lipase family protein [Syntrophomonadaceae bacterium]